MLVCTGEELRPSLRKIVAQFFFRENRRCYRSYWAGGGRNQNQMTQSLKPADRELKCDEPAIGMAKQVELSPMEMLREIERIGTPQLVSVLSVSDPRGTAVTSLIEGDDLASTLTKSTNSRH